MGLTIPSFARLALLASFLFAGVAACSRKHEVPVAQPAPVTVVKAITRDMPIVVNAPGSVEAINSVAVKSLVDGQFMESKVADGADVRQGELLFRIDPRPAQAALTQAIATQAKDQATLEQAQSQVKRYAGIAAKGYLSADQMEQYRTNLGVAKAALKVDESNVAAARVALGYTEIHAPLSGRIGRILIQPGNIVKANDTNALVTINQIEPIYVNFSLPSALLGRMQSAQKEAALVARAAVIGVDKPIEGKVAFIDNAVDTSTGTIRLRAEFANSEHALWPGQLVTVDLVLGHDRNAVVVPAQAVQNGPDGPYVFVVKPDGHAEQRKVATSAGVDNLAVIAKGLASGETVVLDGQSRVENGAAVKATQTDAGNAPAPAAEAAVAVPAQ